MQIRGKWSAGPGDDQARFLADLRALRDLAAIGYDELAARAHYPSDVLKEAENGPLLPGLPVLTAYVRACEGDVPDWEERWRQLARVVADDPGLPIRPPGASPAAVAGARAGVGVAPPDVYDPERIRAALRGGSAGSHQNGRRNGDPGIAAPLQGTGSASGAPPGWDADLTDWPDSSAGLETSAGTNLDADPGPGGETVWPASSGWDSVADPAVTKANGHHASIHESGWPADPAAESTDSAEREGQVDQFRWLPDTEPEARSDDAEFSWSSHAGATQTDANQADAQSWPAAEPWPADTGLAGTGPAGTGPLDTGLADAGLGDAGVGDAGRAGGGLGDAGPRQDSEVLPLAERDAFWATSASPAPADLQLPAAPPRRVEEPAAGTGSAAAAQAAGTAPASQLPAADSARSGRDDVLASARIPGEPARHEKDRFFPVRLLVIIVIAALIGSALVLLLK